MTARHTYLHTYSVTLSPKQQENIVLQMRDEHTFDERLTLEENVSYWISRSLQREGAR